MSSASIHQVHNSSQPPLALLPDLLDGPLISLVKHNGSFNYYGLVDAPFLDSAAEYLATRTDSTVEPALHSLRFFLQTTHADCGGKDTEKAACWLTIRLSRPNAYFAVPRWHQDGRMYQYESRENVARSKYGVTIVGPPTLMFSYTSPENVRTLNIITEKYFYWWGKHGAPAVSTTQEERDQASDRHRSELAEQFKNEELLHIENGEIARFSWGRDDSPIHSEPDIVSDRVFMTVLFGSENELRSMAEFRAEPFGKPTMR